MACNTAEQPLLSGFVESNSQENNKLDAFNRRRRRLQRSISAPAAPLITNSIPPPESTYDKPRPNSRKAAAFLATYLGIGTICFYAVRSQIKGVNTDGILDGIIDSVYFCVVTMTTIGYGDVVPNGVLSKLLVCAFVFAGIALFALLILSKAVEYLCKKHEILLVKALHTCQIDGLNDILNEIEMTSNARYKCVKMVIVLLLLILLGTIHQAVIGKMTITDAFFCVCATITTLGYGDKSLFSRSGRIFAAYWMLLSTISLALFFLYVAELHIQGHSSSGFLLVK